MQTHAKVLAMDLGASGGKCFAGVFDEGGFALREVHRFSHEPSTLHIADRTGRVEERSYWDDLLISRNLVEGLRAYRREIGGTADSVGIDTWGADGVFVTEDGVFLGPMYCYRDHRLDGMIEVVKSKMDPTRLYEITGIHFQPFNVSNQLLWFMTNRGDLVRRGVRFLPAPTFFGYCLGGVTAVDSSWASVTQLMDARRRKWSREVLRALSIPARIMPRIVAPGTVVGELRAGLAESIGLNPAPIIAVGAHDTASAFAAAPVSKAASALIISSGTWSLIGKLLPRPLTSPEAMAANMSNEGGIGNVRFLKNCMGTWLVQELRRAWRARDGREMNWEELNRLTEQGRPFAASIDPDDRGFFNPQNMESAIVDFCRRTGQEPPGGPRDNAQDGLRESRPEVSHGSGADHPGERLAKLGDPHRGRGLAERLSQPAHRERVRREGGGRARRGDRGRQCDGPGHGPGSHREAAGCEGDDPRRILHQ